MSNNIPETFELSAEFIDACSDNQLGNLEIEWTEDLEALVQSWTKPEPKQEELEVGTTNEWFDKSDNTFDPERTFSILVDVIEIQARMAKGIEKIQLAQGNKDHAWKVYLQAKQAGVSYEDRGYLYRNAQAWTTNVKKLWAHWNTLKDECTKLINGNKYIWAMYFKYLEGDNSVSMVAAVEKLSKEEFSRYGAYGETAGVDDQFVRDSETYITQLDELDTIEVFSRREDREAEREINIDWSRKDQAIVRRKAFFAKMKSQEAASNAALDSMIDSLF